MLRTKHNGCGSGGRKQGQTVNQGRRSQWGIPPQRRLGPSSDWPAGTFSTGQKKTNFPVRCPGLRAPRR
eukprot:5990445-Alexandrium_andersonii.AAC.1